MVTATWTGCFNRHISPEEQKLYDHLLYWVELESPAELIERFRALFIDGLGYPDAEVIAALEQVTASKQAAQEFHYVLNRCCHILINRWQSRSQLQWAVPQLIDLFDRIPPVPVAGIMRPRYVKRLRDLVLLFIETEQYMTLRRLAQVLSQASDPSSTTESSSLGTLIRRYPYLYEHCLLSEDSTREQQHTIRKIQAQMQKQFEVDLSQYITYQARRSQIGSHLLIPTPQRVIHPVKNPTLLNDRELGLAVKHYVGQVEGSKTYRDLAFSFMAHSGHAQTYRGFKDDLYQYITASIDPAYGNRQFNNQLYDRLKHTFPESNSQILNDFLLVRTCSQLLSFLVVDSLRSPHHFVFVDLISNLGPILTTGLLLKIVLLCRKVRPYLEKRFSILFNHYEAYSRDAVQWLINALENLNVALSTHFGELDLSFIH